MADRPSTERPRLRLPSLPREQDATMSARRRVLESRLDPIDDEPASPGSPRSTRSPAEGGMVGEVPASRRAPIAPPAVLGAGPTLSPPMTAVFGGLFGLATVTTIVALLVQGVPPRDDRAAENSLAAPPSGALASAPGAAPKAEPKVRTRTKIAGPWRVSELGKQPGVKIVEDTMQRRAFVTALGEKGVPKDQVYRILKAFEGVRKFDRTGKKDRFIVALDRASNAVLGFEFVVSTREVWQARTEGGALTASQLDMQIAEEEYAGAFYVGTNLAKSMSFGGFEPDLARMIDEAFAGRLSSDSLEEGGIVRVIATEETALGEFAGYKGVVAIEYRPPDPSASPVRAYTLDDRARGYFDDRGRQPDGSGWASPVPGAPITSRFNPRRMHPKLHKIMPHTGTDFGAPTGTPIYSVFRGKVTHLGPAGPCGNMVAMLHPNGIESGYCHMSKIAPALKMGAKIGTKTLIGYVGTTGRSTGPHLHFWTKKDGKFFDSETLKMDGFRVLPPSERPAFGLRKGLLDARLETIPLPDPPPAEPAAPTPAGATAADASGDPSDTDVGDADVKTKSKAKADKPMEIDPGEGEDLVGPNLSP